MTDMQSFITDLLAATPEGRRELVRAQLRVSVAEELLLRMEALQMSKAQLAQTLGVTRSAVSQALTGSRNMSLNLLADMAAALGLNARVVLESRNATAHVAADLHVAYRVVGSAQAASTVQRGAHLQLVQAPRQVQPIRVPTSSTSAAAAFAPPATAIRL